MKKASRQISYEYDDTHTNKQERRIGKDAKDGTTVLLWGRELLRGLGLRHQLPVPSPPKPTHSLENAAHSRRMSQCHLKHFYMFGFLCR